MFLLLRYWRKTRFWGSSGENYVFSCYDDSSTTKSDQTIEVQLSVYYRVCYRHYTSCFASKELGRSQGRLMSTPKLDKSRGHQSTTFRRKYSNLQATFLMDYVSISTGIRLQTSFRHRIIDFDEIFDFYITQWPRSRYARQPGKFEANWK